MQLQRHKMAKIAQFFDAKYKKILSFWGGGLLRRVARVASITALCVICSSAGSGPVLVASGLLPTSSIFWLVHLSSYGNQHQQSNGYLSGFE